MVSALAYSGWRAYRPHDEESGEDQFRDTFRVRQDEASEFIINMDPLSVAASVVAVLGASTKCAKLLHQLIHDFRHAPCKMTVLSNEVNDLNAVLTEIEVATSNIESVAQTHQNPEGKTPGLSGGAPLIRLYIGPPAFASLGRSPHS
jgi:Fungal N-terminal domain of STAND proteins